MNAPAVPIHPVFRDILDQIEALPNVKSPDFIISGGGSSFLLTPQTKSAYDWIEEHLDPNVQYGQQGSYSIRQSEIGQLAVNLSIDGLSVRWIY